MAKQAFHAKEREFQELLGECREKVAHATKIADMRVADEKTAGKLALDAKQRELQDLKSDCEHRLANAAKALVQAVQKERLEAKAESRKLEAGWERERKASAWDIQQLRGEAEALANGKRACEEAMKQARGDLAQRQAALVSAQSRGTPCDRSRLSVACHQLGRGLRFCIDPFVVMLPSPSQWKMPQSMCEKGFCFYVEASFS
jgi:hypothetical protein